MLNFILLVETFPVTLKEDKSLFIMIKGDREKFERYGELSICFLQPYSYGS